MSCPCSKRAVGICLEAASEWHNISGRRVGGEKILKNIIYVHLDKQEMNRRQHGFVPKSDCVL